MKSILSQPYTPQNLTLHVHVTVKSRNQSLFLKVSSLSTVGTAVLKVSKAEALPIKIE